MNLLAEKNTNSLYVIIIISGKNFCHVLAVIFFQFIFKNMRVIAARQISFSN